MSQVDNIINIKDLFAEIIRKCWLIVICIIVFATALGGYKYMQRMQSQEEVATELSKEEEEAVLEYVAAVREYESVQEYCEDSILFTCNPYNVYQTELQYMISGDVDVDDVATIRAAYADYVLFGRLASDIFSNNKKYSEKALRDVIDTDYVIREQGETLKTVRIMIYAKDKQQSKILIKYVKEQIEAYTKEIKQTIGNHEFILLDENTVTVLKTDIKTTKEHHENYRDTLKDEVENVETQLSSVQMDYALELLGKEVKSIDSPKEISLKEILIFVVLGGIIGAVFAIMVIIAFYFFTYQIKTEKEIEYLYSITHLGNCSVNKRGVFDKLADKVFYKNRCFDIEENKEMIALKIIALCKEKNIQNICFVGKVSEDMKNCINIITDIIQKEGIEIFCIENILKDYDLKKTLSKNIIYIGKLRETTVQEAKEQIEFCREQNLKIFGYVTFSK